MRSFYRWMRRGLAALFVIGVIAGTAYYLFFTITGIIEAIDRQTQLRQNSEFMVGTATLMAPTIQAESLELAAFPVVDESVPAVDTNPTEIRIDPTESGHTDAVNTDEASETPVAADTATPIVPTETPEPTDTTEPTLTDSPEPSDTPRPSRTPTEPPTEAAQVATLIPTNTPRSTAIPTNTPRPTRTFTASPTVLPTETYTPAATFTPSITLPPTWTLVPTTTPYPFEGTYATPVTTPILEVWPAAPLVEDDPDIVNFVLLGSDNFGQTDVIILVSVNKEVNSVAMWHLPRDLLVYIPGYTVDKINRAYAVGNQMNWEGGGAGLMKETILYNFGIEVDFYARVNFNEFAEIITEMGGLEISIDCELTDWALITPDADITLEESYERYTLRVGHQTLTPYYALWYARSRQSTSDLDRGRRQMDVLRAIWEQARNEGLLTQVTELWPKALEIVETDMELADVLSFVPLATELEISNIQRYAGSPDVHFYQTYTPDDGRFAFIPDWEQLHALARDFVTPPTENQLASDLLVVELYDGSNWGAEYDKVAADRLAWEGIIGIPMGALGGSTREITLMWDYTGEEKGSAIDAIQEIVRVANSNINDEFDPDSVADYRIEIGQEYSYNSCVYGTSADEIELGPPPIPTADPNAEPTATPQTVGG